MLTFDEPSHTYRWHGVVVPSVTQCLAILHDLSHIPPAILANAQQEGVATHKMVELAVADDLDEDSLPDWLRPKLAGWRRFVDETGFCCIASEHRMYHRDHGYAGTVDLVGPFREGGLNVVDLKRSFAAGVVIGAQLSAYQMMWEQDGERIDKRFALILGDETYRLEEFRNPMDKSAFLAALTLNKWMANGHK